MWDSDDSPSFDELLLCTLVRFALFVTKQEIFEKGESYYYFKTENIHHCCGSQFSKILSQNYVVSRQKKATKSFF